MGERTGSRVFQWVWSYVSVEAGAEAYKARREEGRGGKERRDKESLVCRARD
ncbi:hypothetical protein B0T20DRAFT_403835 [Sordaria brevicollis]|uniref:Uncharacterized protein n=1 Tax=Sordaria brevicollis TaxID=83679 RepID=A0AAE0PLX1_SORBR|nr:hypothetical protein B0T20DRAFT_403835 [Sordaria brevicollis]